MILLSSATEGTPEDIGKNYTRDNPKASPEKREQCA